VAGQQPHSKERLEELILYIAQRMEHDNHVGRGRIKLAKLLWRSDFAAFWQLGKPITETKYHADEHGPSPVDELLALRDLQAQGRLDLRNEWDRQQIPVVAGDPPPRLELFSQDELAIVDAQLDQYRYVTGKAMRDEAHEFPGYKHAWRGGRGKHTPVPFESVFWDDRKELEDWEEEHAASLARDLGLSVSS
jgi:Protein of unknown function (DUF4065)